MMVPHEGPHLMPDSLQLIEHSLALGVGVLIFSLLLLTRRRGRESE